MHADELLTTTRAVRKRLDLERPVEPSLIDECLEIALQAPTGGNTQGWHFVVVYDVGKRAALAARARGLGTAWTTVHLVAERAAAELLDIPYDKISQVALIPTAYTIGTDFKPALRRPLDEVVHVDQW